MRTALFPAQKSFETDHLSIHRRTAHPSQPRDRSCTSREWCRRRGRETRQWPGTTSRHPATKSHWHDVQHHDPRDDYARKPQACGALKGKENRRGSYAYMNRRTHRRQPIKSRVFRDSEYIAIYGSYLMPLTSSAGLLTFAAAFAFPFLPVLSARVPFFLAGLVALILSHGSERN